MIRDVGGWILNHRARRDRREKNKKNPRSSWLSVQLCFMMGIILLAGCASDNTAAVPPTAAQATDIPATIVPAIDSAAPAILQQPVLANGSLAIISYTGPEGQCLALSFDTRVFIAQHCGTFEGDGVGFIAMITDPTGAPLRLAYGLVLDPDISAVAIEFVGGGNAHSFTENGSYLILLEEGQTPRRATGVNPFGNMVGQWTFE